MANVIEKVRAIAADAGRTGMAVGAPVVTLDGVMPVEFVEPGDRIVTRTGIRKLTAKRASRYTGTAYVVKGGSLGHVLKGEDSVLLPATRVLVRDWRAVALFGVEAARVKIEALEDGEFVLAVRVTDLPVFTLEFDGEDVAFAAGMEIGCGAAEPALA